MATQGQWGGLFDGEWFGATGEAPPGAMSGAATFAFSATGTLTSKVVQRTDGGPDELDRAMQKSWDRYLKEMREHAERGNIAEEEAILMAVMTVVLETT